MFIHEVFVVSTSRRMSLAGAFARFSPSFKGYLLAMFVLSVGSLPLAVILLKTQSVGLLIADIPLFYMMYNLSYAGFSLSAGKMSDRVGARVVIFAGYAILVLSYFILNFAHSGNMLVLGFLLLGLFPALTDGVTRSFAAQLTTEDLRGGGLGWLSAANGFGALIAGIGGGYLWQVYSPGAAFASAAFVVALGAVLLRTSLWR
jgi:MFS family permease